METWVVLLMSITALATSWSAYQANIWNGEQSSKLAAAEELRTIKAEEHLADNQTRMMDRLIVLSIISSMAENRHAVVDLLLPRTRKELRTAIEAWLALNPLHNPSAPPTPLELREYHESVIAAIEARQHRLTREFKESTKEADEAGKAGDNYVLTTVLFAVVLFFGGLASTFETRGLKRAMLIVATGILVITLGGLTRLPVLMG